MEGKVVKVTEELHDEKVAIRLVTVRVSNPWPNNYYEDYTFRDETRRFAFGDSAEIEFRAIKLMSESAR